MSSSTLRIVSVALFTFGAALSLANAVRAVQFRRAYKVDIDKI